MVRTGEWSLRGMLEAPEAPGEVSCRIALPTAPAYFRDFQSLMADFEGRPHWGKTVDRGPESLAALYPRWDDFRSLRDRMDPEGVFRNACVDRLFPSDERPDGTQA